MSNYLSLQKQPFRSMQAFVLSTAFRLSLGCYRRDGSAFRLLSAGPAWTLCAEPDFVFDGDLFLAMLSRPPDTAIDVSTGISFLSILALRLMEASSRVVAIEANLYTYFALLNRLLMRFYSCLC